MNNAFTEIMKPFLSTGLTTEQRIAISDEINVIVVANTKVLEIIGEMEDDKKANGLLKATEKIGNGSRELFMLIT